MWQEKLDMGFAPGPTGKGDLISMQDNDDTEISQYFIQGDAMATMGKENMIARQNLVDFTTGSACGSLPRAAV
ncbi:MAG: hypothetical protein HQL73_03985 [Magnetococcales bacterium]|nr:hypothetical protein [Magnetococcales bacterium]